jgi:hypothetical protein
MVRIRAIIIAGILGIFFCCNLFTNGFNSIAIIKENAKGIIMPLSTNSIYTKSMIPKSVTVARK